MPMQGLVLVPMLVALRRPAAFVGVTGARAGTGRRMVGQQWGEKGVGAGRVGRPLRRPPVCVHDRIEGSVIKPSAMGRQKAHSRAWTYLGGRDGADDPKVPLLGPVALHAQQLQALDHLVLRVGGPRISTEVYR